MHNCFTCQRMLLGLDDGAPPICKITEPKGCMHAHGKHQGRNGWLDLHCHVAIFGSMHMRERSLDFERQPETSGLCAALYRYKSTSICT